MTPILRRVRKKRGRVGRKRKREGRGREGGKEEKEMETSLYITFHIRRSHSSHFLPCFMCSGFELLIVSVSC